MGIVDLRKIFDGYWKTKQADAALKDRAADMEKEFKNMVADFEKAKEDYSKVLASASDQAAPAEEREKRKKSAEEKLKYLNDQGAAIEQYRRQSTATLDEQKKRMRDNLLGEIRTVLNAKAKTASYTMVIDVAAETINNTPVVLYHSGENDLTQEILTHLNATAPADSGTGRASEKKDEGKTDDTKAGKKEEKKK
jgi:Skp family chaperone for outer membrane proteins